MIEDAGHFVWEDAAASADGADFLGATSPAVSPSRCQNRGMERLFDLEDSPRGRTGVPVARPTARRPDAAGTLGEFVGQEHLLGRGAALRTAIEEGKPHSMILYGPPARERPRSPASLAVNAQAGFEEARP